MKNVRNRGFEHHGNTEHCSALARGFREVRDAIVVRIVDGHRVTVYESGLVEPFELVTCGVRRIGQVAKLLRTRAFGSGTARRRRCRNVVSK